MKPLLLTLCWVVATILILIAMQKTKTHLDIYQMRNDDQYPFFPNSIVWNILIIPAAYLLASFLVLFTCTAALSLLPLESIPNSLSVTGQMAAAAFVLWITFSMRPLDSLAELYHPTLIHLIRGSWQIEWPKFILATVTLCAFSPALIPTKFLNPWTVPQHLKAAQAIATTVLTILTLCLGHFWVISSAYHTDFARTLFTQTQQHITKEPNLVYSVLWSPLIQSYSHSLSTHPSWDSNYLSQQLHALFKTHYEHLTPNHKYRQAALGDIRHVVSTHSANEYQNIHTGIDRLNNLLND